MEDFLNLRLYYSFISNKSLSITKVTATSNYHLRNAIWYEEQNGCRFECFLDYIDWSPGNGMGWSTAGKSRVLRCVTEEVNYAIY